MSIKQGESEHKILSDNSPVAVMPANSFARNLRLAALTNYVGLAAAFAYAISSLSIILLNKAILTPYKFKHPPLMALVHLTISWTCLVALKHFKWIKYKDVTLKSFKVLGPGSFIFVGNILAGMWALQLVQVPMFTTLRRLTALLTIVLSKIYNNISPSRVTSLSVAVMISGAFVAGAGDLNWDARGYAASMLNNILTAGYLVWSKRAMSKLETQTEKVSKFEVLFYNVVVAVPVLLVVCLATNTFEEILEFQYLYDRRFQIAFVASGIIAFFINLTTLWCTEMNSPLTTSITGQTKNILVTLIGSMIFVDTEPTVLLCVGVFVSISGSVLYAAEKYREKMTSQKKQKAEHKEENLANEEEVRLVVNGQANVSKGSM